MMPVMQILALPVATSNLDSTSPEDQVHTRYRCLAPISPPHNSGEKLTHELIQRCVAIEGNFSGGPQQIPAENERQTLGHTISEAHNPCAAKSAE